MRYEAISNSQQSCYNLVIVMLCTSSAHNILLFTMLDTIAYPEILVSFISSVHKHRQTITLSNLTIRQSPNNLVMPKQGTKFRKVNRAYRVPTDQWLDPSRSMLSLFFTQEQQTNALLATPPQVRP